MYRSWHDPAILASLGALLAAVVARWAGPIALGIVAGALASLIESGVLIVVGGISADESIAWAVTVATAGVLAVVLLLVLRPGHLPWWPVPRRSTGLVIAGGVLLLLMVLVQNSDGQSLVTVSLLFLLDPLATVAFAWLALAAVDARNRTWLSAAVLTYVVLAVIGALPIWTAAGAPVLFLISAAGSALVAAGVLSRGLRLLSRP